jgi:hypothetical protein
MASSPILKPNISEDDIITIHSLLMKLCIDIENILSMNHLKITDKVVSEVIFNIKVLKDCKAIFDRIPIKIILPVLMKNKNIVPKKHKEIYNRIVEYFHEPDTNIFETLLSIYDSILKLYNDSKKNDVYKKIRDHKINKSSDLPPIPMRPQLSKELMIYRANIDYLNNPLNEDKNKEEVSLTFNRRYPLNVRKEYDEKLIEHDNLVIYYEKQLKKNEKQLKSTSPMKSDSDIEYTNVIDPYSQKAFSDMSPKKLEYLSNIVYNNGEDVFYYRFDTVNIYNYILSCIDLCEKPINFFNRVELTDENLDEICNKIKHFTKTPTYNSSKEIRAMLNDDCIKYDNRLEFDWDITEVKNQEGLDIEGIVNVYLNVKLGDIIFRLWKVLSLPYFNESVLDRFPKNSHIYPDDILDILEDKLKDGKLIGSRFFPYRQKNILMNLPQFKFEFNDNDTKKTLERLKRYKIHISEKYS